MEGISYVSYCSPFIAIFSSNLPTKYNISKAYKGNASNKKNKKRELGLSVIFYLIASSETNVLLAIFREALLGNLEYLLV